MTFQNKLERLSLASLSSQKAQFTAVKSFITSATGLNVAKHFYGCNF